MSTPTVEELLALAHNVVTWADQCHEGILTTAGGKHYWPKRQEYMLAYVRYWATRRPLTVRDVGGCIGCAHTPKPDGVGYDWEIRPDCPYHLAASLQPDNHRIPWNCSTYYDGCNCQVQEPRTP